MLRRYEPYLKKNARMLRKNMTETEVILWSVIRRRQVNGLRFYRQKPIGKYIVDFYCPEKKLVIEVDGGQHYESGNTVDEDHIRDEFLSILGLKVLRFTNTDIRKNLISVIDAIREASADHVS
ncbi:MAG TPA: DUF559 domain-containing protein [Candidatus Fimivivens sp.]|nr:DUF559 domain-containing protein [Candidatus Fimivivens sp.]